MSADWPRRRSIRRKGWDYRTPGGYFITICTYQKAWLFEEAPIRTLVEEEWCDIPRKPHAHHIRLDTWVVMPNHIHGILLLVPPDTGTLPHHRMSPGGSRSPAGSISTVVARFKSAVTRRINQRYPINGEPVWQRGYYDHIIRDPAEWERIRAYIEDNPRRWATSPGSLDALVRKMHYHSS